MSKSNVPYESTLANQIHMQIQQYLDLDHLDVMHSSNFLENEVGWDSKVEFMKGIVFQYKRPGSYGDGCQFKLPIDQLESLQKYNEKLGGDVAYYALPPILKHENKDETLSRTLFINASNFRDASKDARDEIKFDEVPLYYCKDYVRAKDGQFVIGTTSESTSSGLELEYHYMPPSDILGWEELLDKIKNCTAGTVMRKQNTSMYEQFKDSIDDLEPVSDNNSQYLIRLKDENMFI
jgi:hypothetical protein